MANPASAVSYKLEKAGTIVPYTKQGKPAPYFVETESPEKEVEIAQKIVEAGVGGSVNDLGVKIKDGGQNDTLLAWDISNRNLDTIDPLLVEEANNVLAAAGMGSLVESTGPSLKDTISNSLLIASPLTAAGMAASPVVTGAITGGLGGYVNDGVQGALTGAITGGALGALSAPTEGLGILDDITGAIYDVGQSISSLFEGLSPFEAAEELYASGVDDLSTIESTLANAGVIGEGVSLALEPSFIEGISTGSGLIPNSWGEVGLSTMANLFSDAQGFWVSGADPLVASGNLIEKYGVTPELANAAVNEAFGIGIPSTFGGGTSIFTGSTAGALTDWFTDPNQVFDRAKILSDGGLSADEAVQRLVSDGVESKLAIDAVNEAAGIGIPGNGIPGDPGNVSQFTGEPAGALTGGAPAPSVDSGIDIGDFIPGGGPQGSPQETQNPPVVEVPDIPPPPVQYPYGGLVMPPGRASGKLSEAKDLYSNRYGTPGSSFLSRTQPEPQDIGVVHGQP